MHSHFQSNRNFDAMNLNDALRPSTHVPRSYSSDGGFTITGMMLTMAVGALVALVVGLLAGVIGQYFYMVLIFPIAIGGAVAGAQVAVIGRSKVRNPLVCGFAGLIGGVIAVATMHYVDYVVFQQETVEADVKYQAAKHSLSEIEDQESRAAFATALAAYEADRAVDEARNVGSFAERLPALRAWIDLLPALRAWIDLIDAHRGLAPTAGCFRSFGTEAGRRKTGSLEQKVGSRDLNQPRSGSRSYAVGASPRLLHRHRVRAAQRRQTVV
jgi:hypothetical protein